MQSRINLATAQKIWSLLTLSDRRKAFLLLAMMIIGMVLEILSVGIVIPALALLSQDHITVKYPAIQPIIHALGNPSQQGLIITGMLLLVGLFLIKAIFLAMLVWKQTSFAYGVQEQVSQRLFTVYLRQPYTFHLQRNSAQLIRNLVNEVSLLTFEGMLPSMVLFSESLVLLGLCTLLLVVEPLGSIIVFFILAATAWSFQLLTRKHITRWGRERQRHEGMRIQHLQQGLGGAKDVKLLGRETEFLEQYREHNAQSAHFGQLNGTLQQLPKLWLELLAVTGIALLVIGMLARGSDISSIVPTIGVFGIAAFRLMPSVSRILAAVHSLRYGLPIINTLHEELNLPVDRQTLQKTLNSSTLQHEIRLTDVSFAYTDSAPALNSLSIVIKKGETVGFIGPSGSGKSTLVDIILGLLSPSSGKVTMDGQDIQQNPRAWQDQIGYVPQSIYLTDDTLRRNVAFGLSNEQIDDKGVQRAIHAAQLEEFVVSLPEGLETIVGERGIRLSGGQRQRIGIARAHYHNPVVLVLDEATSSLDSATEHDVMQAVRDMQGTKTIIIVAHRLSTVAHCDRLYRLERGRVVQVGRPDDLIMGEIG